MADVQELEETTTEVIEEHELELCLGFRSTNASPPRHHQHHHPNNLLEVIDNNVSVSSSNDHAVTKREEQAICRHEAKAKRKFAAKDGIVTQEQDEEERLSSEGLRRKKGTSFGSLVREASLSLGCNASGFRPYQGQYVKLQEGEGGDGETRLSFSGGSSSGVSDNNYHSNSAAGGNSSDTSCHSSHPQSQELAPNVSPATIPVSHPCSSAQESHLNKSNITVSQPQLYSLPSNQTSLCRSSNQSSKSPEIINARNVAPLANETHDRSSPDKKPIATPQSPSSKEAKGVIVGNPPKHNGQTSQWKGLLPQMPCVSATGNGPNGKTISGFLYKYSKTEVSIVCVCHGASFSPARFVEHAGGVDVEHPLRHIRVVPFAFG